MTWHPDIPHEYRNQIVTGDARVLAERIPDESIDLIFTDPVYESIDDYTWLSRMASRALKPNGSLLCFCAIGLIPDTHDALRNSLSYRWRFVVRPVNSKEFYGRLLITSQELLWYEKEKASLYETVFDVQLSTTKGMYRVNGSNWGKGADVIAKFIAAMSPPEGTVLDPFSGSGTISTEAKKIGRNYIAFEIDREVAELSQERIAFAQPPLPIIEPVQESLFKGD